MEGCWRKEQARREAYEDKWEMAQQRENERMVAGYGVKGVDEKAAKAYPPASAGGTVAAEVRMIRRYAAGGMVELGPVLMRGVPMARRQALETEGRKAGRNNLRLGRRQHVGCP